MVDVPKYYGVYIPKESLGSDQNPKEKWHVYLSKDEAHKIVKEYKSARFKCFGTIEEAFDFSLKGSTSGPGNPNVVCESTPYKSLKRPEIFKFRRFIETNDFESVKTLMWENPRYLIGIGDTPTIVMEGPRYNALHIAAKNNRPEIADLILRTVSDESFCQLLYGAAGDNSYIVRSEKIVDLYLNTPDKALNETALHFAAKYGFFEVVKVFVQYPKLEFNPKNKKGLTPKEITCELSNAKNKNVLISEIHKLLDPDELFFVPIWRSNDDIERPMIGNPFSPKSPPVCPVPTSPLSPSKEIKAVAGPMSHTEANKFHEAWSKSPKKILSSGTSYISKGNFLKGPPNLEKGLEAVGRTLAKLRHVSWKEYWPFLDRFIDLRSDEGLNLLEEYINKIIMNTTYLQDSENFSVINSPVSELCQAFSKFSISSLGVIPNDNKEELKTKNSKTTPYLLVENLCMLFAKNIINTFTENFSRNMPVDENIVILIKNVCILSEMIDGCRKEPTFRDFPFNKIHSRIALWIIRNLSLVQDHSLDYVTQTFRVLEMKEKSEIIHYISLSSSMNFELDDIIQILNCVNDRTVKLLCYETRFENNPETEESCKEQWSFIEKCNCFQKDQNDNIKKWNSRNGIFEKREHPFRKRIIFEDENFRSIIKLNKISEVTNVNNNCDNFIKSFPMDLKICDNNNSDSDPEEEFCTPPTSLSVSEDEMESPEEGPDLHIYDNKGTSMDNAVLEAIADVDIDRNKYPSIYRWKHSILLYSKMNRLNWPSPNAKQLKLN